MKHSKKLYNRLVVLIGLTLTILIVILGWQFFSAPPQETDPSALAEGLSYLESLEDRNAADINAQILAASQTRQETQPTDLSEAEPSVSSPETDELPSDSEPAPSETPEQTESASSEPAPAEDEQLLAWKAQIDSADITVLTGEERADYRSRLSGCAVIGDSMAQAALEYGFLDSAHVFYRRGYAVGQLGDAIAEAAAMLPSTVIFFTGLNDTDYYAEPELYAAAYLEKIQELKTLLPDARVYVCSMLPPGDALGAVRPDLARAPLYDDALRSMCSENGISYIDTTWMVNQSLYMADGIHFVSSFYDIWIQYVTKCAGL